MGVEGAGGAMDIARLLPPATGPRRIVLAVGTGTTLAGIAAAAAAGDSISGIAALKKVPDIEPRVAGLLQELAPRATPVWEILYDYHAGGFARVSPETRAFQLAFEAVQGIPLDPVYTAKAMFMVHSLRSAGIWDKDEALTVVHTGGLQGRLGYDWLNPAAGAIPAE